MREKIIIYKSHLEKTYRSQLSQISQLDDGVDIVKILNETFSYLVELTKKPLDDPHLIKINSNIFNGIIERNDDLLLWDFDKLEVIVIKYILIYPKLLTDVINLLNTDKTNISSIKLLLRSLRGHLDYLYADTDDDHKPVFKHLLLDKFSQDVESSDSLTLFIIQIYLLNNDMCNTVKYASKVMRSGKTESLLYNLALIDPNDKQIFQKVYDKLDRNIIEQELKKFRVKSKSYYNVTIDPIENYWKTFISPQVTQKEFNETTVLDFSKVIFESGLMIDEIDESQKINSYVLYRDTIRIFNMLKGFSNRRKSLETAFAVEDHVQNIRDNYERIVENTQNEIFKNKLKLLITVMNKAFLDLDDVGNNNGVREQIKKLKNENKYKYIEKFQPSSHSEAGPSSHSEAESGQVGT